MKTFLMDDLEQKKSLFSYQYFWASHNVIFIYSTFRWEGWHEIWLSGSTNLIIYPHHVMFFWSLIKYTHWWKNVFKFHWKISRTILSDQYFLLIPSVSTNLMELQCTVKTCIWNSPMQMYQHKLPLWSFFVEWLCSCQTFLFNLNEKHCLIYLISLSFVSTAESGGQLLCLTSPPWE